tara:strand:+ start:127 stop:627 length:501 start_codon:yes stop_codon:yes gene_type:complete
MFKVVDNFLDKEYFKEIQKVMLDEFFPWHYNSCITDSKDTKDKFYFTHNFYNNIQHKTLHPGVASSHFNLLIKFLRQLKCKSLIRVKANLYLNKGKKQIHKFHKDFSFSHNGCLLFINDNDGLTYFSKKQVKPKANRIVFFDPSKDHASSLPTDNNRRININVNYF